MKPQDELKIYSIFASPTDVAEIDRLIKVCNDEAQEIRGQVVALLEALNDRVGKASTLELCHLQAIKKLRGSND